MIMRCPIGTLLVLDYHSQRAWKEFIGQQERDVPTIKEFLKFLNERCHTFEMLKDNDKMLKIKQEVTQPELHNECK